jgi:phage tail sheath protein FI
MPVTVTYPGLYIEELPSSSHAIAAAPTSVTAFVGYTHPFKGEYAQRTPPDWGKAIRIFNFTEYERIFGGLYRSNVVDYQVAYAVKQFFLNGGSDAYVVGLQPKYFDPTAAHHPAEEIKGASKNLSGIKFTAKQLTDITIMTVTISNVRPSAPAGANDTADILITYGSQVEPFRGVTVSNAPPATVTDENFIANRLATSQLVQIEPTTLGLYPSSYTLPTSPSIELSAMPGPSFEATGWTPFNADDFVKVFADDSSLDKVDIFNLLVVPGVADTSVWSNAIAFCERKRAFFILDPPNDASADGKGTAPLRTMETVAKGGTVPVAVPNGALYFPNLKSLDPITKEVMELPPSGSVAGIYARTDTKRGVWKAPAGLETSILNTTGVVERGRMTDMRQGTLNPLGVNVLRSFPGSGTVVWGARTTVTNNSAFEQWRYVPVRRTALFIEQTLLRNLGWVVFEPNDEPLWAAIRLSIENFMLSLFRQGAFQGLTPRQAFLVQCDSTTTRQTDIDLGIVNIVVGFRPLKPAEFVIIKIAQLAGQAQA